MQCFVAAYKYMVRRLFCVSYRRVHHLVAEVYNDSAESLIVPELGLQILKTVRTHAKAVVYQLDFWFVPCATILLL